MKAWRAHSPYRAIGVYIGGSDKACAQPNLTSAWLRNEAATGWHFLPLYVGPQAGFGELTAPAKQGRAAASDAVMQAERLGFSARTPIYYDMEAFAPSRTRERTAVPLGVDDPAACPRLFLRHLQQLLVRNCRSFTGILGS